MYNKGDTSFLGKPKVMGAEVVQATLDAIVTYARAHELPAVSLVLHDGGRHRDVTVRWFDSALHLMLGGPAWVAAICRIGSAAAGDSATKACTA